MSFPPDRHDMREIDYPAILPLSKALDCAAAMSGGGCSLAVPREMTGVKCSEDKFHLCANVPRKPGTQAIHTTKASYFAGFTQGTVHIRCMGACFPCQPCLTPKGPIIHCSLSRVETSYVQVKTITLQMLANVDLSAIVEAFV